MSIRLRASVISALLLAVSVTWIACGAAPAGADAPAWVSPAGAVELVGQAHRAMAEGDFDGAIALVDLDEKARRMLGDVYDQGPREEQERLFVHLRGQFRATYERVWQEGAETRPASVGVGISGKGERTVTLTLPAGPGAEQELTELTYVVARQPAGLRIVDRALSLGGRGSTTGAFVELVLRKAARSSTEPATLRDFNDHVEPLMEKVQIQRIPLRAPPGTPAQDTPSSSNE